MPSYPQDNRTKGVQLFFCQTRLAHQPKLAGIKHLNRLESILARAEWHDLSFADGLILDLENNVIECTAGNIFARFSNELVTPDLSNCGVAGVMRERIMQLAPSLSFNLKVQKLSLAQLNQADEVFICNSLYGAWPVAGCDGHTWPLLGVTDKINEVLQS